MAIIKTTGSDFELGTVPSKAEFEARASARRSQFAGSGVEKWDVKYRYDANGSTTTFSGNDKAPEFNIGVCAGNITSNVTSKIFFAPTVYNVHGYRIHAEATNLSASWGTNSLDLPPAPSGPNMAVFPNSNNGWYKSGTYSSAVSFDNTNNTVSTDGTAGNSSQYARIDISDLVDNELIYVTFTIDISAGAVELQQSTSINSHPHIAESGTYTFEMNWSDSTNAIGFQYSAGCVSTVSEFYITRASDISRQDIATLEVWHEKISDLDVVFPYGNVQFGRTSYNGVTLTNSSTPVAYTAFGEWDAGGATKRGGYGLVWSTATDTQRRAFLEDDRNNIYYDNGELIQVRYRHRVSKPRPNGTSHHGNGYFDINDPDWQYQAYFDNLYARGKKSTNIRDWRGDPSTYRGGYESAQDIEILGPRFMQHVMDSAYTNLTTGTELEFGVYSNRVVDYGLSYDGTVYNIPLATIQRNNTGGYHPIHNPEGTRAFRSSTNTSTSTREWHRSDLRYGQIGGVGQCFDSNYVVPDGWEGDGITGTAAATLNSPFGWLSDQPTKYHVRDFRNVAHKIEDYDQFLSEVVAAIDTGGATLGRMSEMITGDFERKGTFVRTALNSFHNEDSNWQWREDKFASSDINRRSGNNAWDDGRPVTMIKRTGNLSGSVSNPSVNYVIRQSVWDSSNSQQYHIHTQYQGKWYRYGNVLLEGAADSGWTAGDYGHFYYRHLLGDGEHISKVNYGWLSNSGGNRYNKPTYSQAVPVVDYVGNVANMPKNWVINGGRINLVKRDFKTNTNWPDLAAGQNYYRLSTRLSHGSVHYVTGNSSGPTGYGTYSSGYDSVTNTIPASGLTSSDWILFFYMGFPNGMMTPIEDLHAQRNLLAIGDVVINNIRPTVEWGSRIGQSCLWNYDMLGGSNGGPFTKTISGTGLIGHGYPMVYANTNYFKYNSDNWTIDANSGLTSSETINGSTVPKAAVRYVPMLAHGNRTQVDMDGHLYLHVAYEEMRYDTSAGSWGVTDGDFQTAAFNAGYQHANRMSNGNGQVVQYGTRYKKLPFFMPTQTRNSQSVSNGDRR